MQTMADDIENRPATTSDNQVLRVDAFVLETAKYASIYTPGVRPALELAESIAFVLNVSRLSPDGTLALATGHDLRRANSEEIRAIKEVFRIFGGEETGIAWECINYSEHKFESLPESQWRYFVIAFTGSNATIVEIERALSIASCDIKIAFTLMKGPFGNSNHPTLIFDPGRFFYLLRGVREGHVPFEDVTASDAEDIRSLHNQLRLCEHSIVNIKRIIQQILDLEALSPRSTLPFLGYFAILESLLTHQPKKTDTIDSITRQIVKKVTLLDNRWQPRIDYGPFRGAKPETVWSVMYAYRSSLAHGGEPDFKTDLQSLGDHHCALKLLKQTVKGVLRQALIEPQLILDLRNC
jgi:hypothetical protein